MRTDRRTRMPVSSKRWRSARPARRGHRQSQRPEPTGQKAAARAERLARALARGPEASSPNGACACSATPAPSRSMRDRIERREANAAWLQAKGRGPASERDAARAARRGAAPAAVVLIAGGIGRTPGAGGAGAFRNGASVKVLRRAEPSDGRRRRHPPPHPAQLRARSRWSACRPNGTGRATSRRSTCSSTATASSRSTRATPRSSASAAIDAAADDPRADRPGRRVPAHRGHAADRATRRSRTARAACGSRSACQRRGRRRHATPASIR